MLSEVADVHHCPVCLCIHILVSPWYLKIVKWWKCDRDRDPEQFELTVQQGRVYADCAVIMDTSEEWEVFSKQ